MIQLGKYIFGLTLQEEVLFLSMLGFLDQIWIVFGVEIEKLNLFDAVDQWIRIFFYEPYVNRYSMGELLESALKKFWTAKVSADSKTELFDFYSCRIYLATFFAMLYPSMTTRQGWLLIPWLVMTGVEVRAPRLYFRVYLWSLVFRYLNFCLDERLKDKKCKAVLKKYEVYKAEALASRRRAKGIRTSLLHKSQHEILKTFGQPTEPAIAEILNDHRKEEALEKGAVELDESISMVEVQSQEEGSMKKIHGNHSIWSAQLYSTQDVPKITDCVVRQLSSIALDLAAYTELTTSHSKTVSSVEDQVDIQCDPLLTFMTPNNFLNYEPNLYHAGFLIDYSTTKPRYQLPDYITNFPRIFQKNRKQRTSAQFPISLHLISPDSRNAVFDHNITYTDILLGLDRCKDVGRRRNYESHFLSDGNVSGDLDEAGNSRDLANDDVVDDFDSLDALKFDGLVNDDGMEDVSVE